MSHRLTRKPRHVLFNIGVVQTGTMMVLSSVLAHNSRQHLSFEIERSICGGSRRTRVIADQSKRLSLPASARSDPPDPTGTQIHVQRK